MPRDVSVILNLVKLTVTISHHRDTQTSLTPWGKSGWRKDHQQNCLPKLRRFLVSFGYFLNQGQNGSQVRGLSCGWGQ